MADSDGESHDYFAFAKKNNSQMSAAMQSSNGMQKNRSMKIVPDNKTAINPIQEQSVSKDDLKEVQQALLHATKLMENNQSLEAVKIFKKYQNHSGINKKLVKERIIGCLNNIGLDLADKDKKEEALAAYHEALKLMPRCSQVYNNIGNLYKKHFEYDQALNAYRRAVAFGETNALAFCNLGHMYHCVGKYYAELVCYDQALRIDPNHALTHWNRSLCLLLFERYEEGFREYEWRFKNKEFYDVDETFYKNLWQGQELGKDKTLIVYTEQGFGDCIQYLRFLPMVKPRAKCKIIFSCKKTFHRMCADLDCIDTLADIEEAKSKYDYHVPLLSLPYIFNITLDNLPAECPYIHVSEDLEKKWAKKIKNKKSLKIAICWGGSRTNKLDHTRSFTIDKLLSLIEIKQVDWYSLQVDREPEIDMSEYSNFINLGPEIEDFADTVAIMKNMDMMITVETAVAHLAGAVNLPCWVYISTYPAWRWHLKREESQWYPSVRLFRQSEPGDWDGVTKDIVKALNEKYKRRIK